MSGVWLRRIRDSRTQIGFGQVIARHVILVHVVNDINFEWLVQSGAWEVDDRPRCPNCAALMEIGTRMKFCIDCGSILDESMPEPDAPVYLATGSTQRL